MARFLAVESCGQCSPCKLDGTLSGKLARSEAVSHDFDVIRRRIVTVAERSRCFLATQQQVVIGSILEHFGDFVAEVLDIRGGEPSSTSATARSSPTGPTTSVTRAQCRSSCTQR